MIAKDRIAAIMRLALPITLGLSSNYIMLFVDLAIVGSLGTSALAAIGLAGVCHTFIAALAGGAIAVQGTVARKIGECSTDSKCLPLNAGLLLALLVGIPLSLLCYFISPFFFSIASSDETVIKEGVSFLRALSLSIVAGGLASAFEGYWTGIAKAKVYMLVTLVINCINAFLNYVLVFGHFGAPTLGVLGSGVASAIAVYAGVIIYFIITFINFRSEGFLRIKPATTLLISLFKLGLPVNLQQFFFSAGAVVLFGIYGQMGAPEAAAATILIRVTYALVIFATALGQSSAVLVSSALGEGDLVGAAQWGWDAGKIGVFCITALGLPLFLFPNAFLSLFLTDLHTISLATVPLQITGIGSGLVSLSFILAMPLFAVGYGNQVAIISFSLRWFFCLPAVWLVGLYLNRSFLEVWLVQVVYGLILVIVMASIWGSGKWKKIKI